VTSAFLDDFGDKIYHSEKVIPSRLIAPIDDLCSKTMGKGLLPVPMQKDNERVSEQSLSHLSFVQHRPHLNKIHKPVNGKWILYFL
jgi:hypothetical protein